MSRVIIYSDFLQSNDRAHILNSLGYDATREGVVLNTLQGVDVLKGSLHEKTAAYAATIRQQTLIKSLLDEADDLQEFEEYMAYERNPNMYTASVFINGAADYLNEKSMSNNVYMKYISERPGVAVSDSETHGLFDQLGNADLEDYLNELEHHNGIVWRDIISLTRSDALELGYDQQKAWRDLLRSHMNTKAEMLGIPLQNFKWCAAFHDEGHHPHVHVMLWDKTGKDGYQTAENIEAFRSALTNDIFANELWLRKEYKSEVRNDFEDQMRQEIHQLQITITKQTASEFHDVLKNKLLHLSESLKGCGSKDYAYQSDEIKKEVNNVLTDMCRSTKKMYDLFERFVKSQVDIGAYYLKDHLNEYAAEVAGKILNPKKNDRKVLQNLILKAAYEVKSAQLHKALIVDASLASLNSKLDNDYKPLEKYLSDENKRIDLAVAVIKTGLLQEKTAENIIGDLNMIMPDEMDALDLILDVKDGDIEIYAKDLKILSTAYDEHFYKSNEYNNLLKVEESCIGHAAGKLFQNFLSILTSDTVNNERLKARMWNIRREDESILKKLQSKKERK